MVKSIWGYYTYRDFLLAKKKGQITGSLPQMSLISSGSTSLAVQTALKKYKLPNLKVLVDVNINPDLIEAMKKIGCEVYQTDLSKKVLRWKDILALTNNENGFDLTSLEALDPSTKFYDWLSYEIINNSPDYCFIPFGTGNLYENILNINKMEVRVEKHDPRFKGNVEILRGCNFIGATSSNPKTMAQKLYSPHLPFVHLDEQWIKLYMYAGYCGPESVVLSLEEKYLEKALEIATSQEIECEYSGIAGLAIMLQIQDKLPKNKKMLIVNTGKAKYQ